MAESIEAFFGREVTPHVPDAWIDSSKRDRKDARSASSATRSNFNRWFYRYRPPRPLEDIEADIRGIETDILRMPAGVTGSGGVK